MIEPLQQRMSERKIFEVIIDMIVDVANKEFKDNEGARLRIYELVADSLQGMVRALRPPESVTKCIQGVITDGSSEAEE